MSTQALNQLALASRVGPGWACVLLGVCLWQAAHSANVGDGQVGYWLPKGYPGAFQGLQGCNSGLIY